MITGERVLRVIMLCVPLLAPRAATPDPPSGTMAPELTKEVPFPERPKGALTGTQLVEATESLDIGQRQSVWVDELVAGNVPNFLRHWEDVVVVGWDLRGYRHEVQLSVSSDYLAMGSDEDFLIAPLELPAALAVADALDFLLPTTKVVDAVYAQADVQLVPIPLPPGPQMRTPAYYLRHHTLVSAQRPPGSNGELIAGHKKDVVLSRRQVRRPDRLALYGWHRDEGDPIQDLTLVHVAHYADYSHGVRAVHPLVWVDGRPRAYLDVLADPILWPLLANEGPFTEAAEILQPD